MGRVLYHCLTGHKIDAAQLDSATEVVLLDGGASVRICRAHGAPIAIVRPDGTAQNDTRAQTGNDEVTPPETEAKARIP